MLGTWCVCLMKSCPGSKTWTAIDTQILSCPETLGASCCILAKHARNGRKLQPNRNKPDAIEVPTLSPNSPQVMESLCSKPLQQPAAPTRAGVWDAAPFLPSGRQRLTAQSPAQNHTGPSPGQAASTNQSSTSAQCCRWFENWGLPGEINSHCEKAPDPKRPQ